MAVGERRLAIFYAAPHTINPQHLDGGTPANPVSTVKPATREQPQHTSRTARLCMLRKKNGWVLSRFPRNSTAALLRFPHKSRVVGASGQSEPC